MKNINITHPSNSCLSPFILHSSGLVLFVLEFVYRRARKAVWNRTISAHFVSEPAFP